ncbi:hypothetical protein [Nocardioides antri]|uniref:Uncharacterized protein n=1 Tax=Nocardioides antri TaxID=2607659 RepID=A0A5B1LTF9_9ACTN|nr:hypothetical protein [Nocardioides antri]KAA1424165.1 hypothetical protein F0U47_19410 [Nocardioides antri]
MRPRAALRSVVVAAATILLLGAAGCGSSEEDPYSIPDEFQDYCEEVEDQQVALGDALGEGGPATGLIKALPSFEALAAEAPDDLDDEWQIVLDRIHDLVDALDAAGVDPETYDRRNPPSGLSQEERDAIDAAARALVSPSTGGAMAGVQQHARDVCKTPLTIGAGARVAGPSAT